MSYMSQDNSKRKRRFIDSHIPPKLRSQVYDILNAIQQCLQQEPRLAIPALMMIYAGIDGMAYVSLPEDQSEVRGADFKAWATSYLLPDSNLPCTAEDLYGARCGLVHAQQVDSRPARDGKARHLWYYVGPGPICLIPFHGGEHRRPVVVETVMLSNAFHVSIDRFFAAIERDSELEKRVWARADRYFDEVLAHGEPMSDGSWVETIPPDFGYEDEFTNAEPTE